MDTSSNKRFVFTGGPGAGKTTLLDALSALGYYCVPDVARNIIKDRRSRGLSPRPDPIEFANEIFTNDVANYLAAPSSEVSFFDRGVIDSMGMMKMCGGITAQELEQNLHRYRYNRFVFLFPPWEEIYETDDERDQSFEDAQHVFESTKTWYSKNSYQMTLTPIGTIDERVAFIEKSVAKALAE